MTRERFGTRLRSLRERAGMTQTRLAEKVGTDKYHISDWERNDDVPETDTVELLAAALGVSAVELLTGRAADQPKPTIRLTTDNFADHLSTDYATSLVKGYTVPADGIDIDDFIVSKLLAWVELESGKSPDVGYEMSRLVAAVFLERLAKWH
jgi:transcriptional regulator with XRE-family HTH domain